MAQSLLGKIRTLVVGGAHTLLDKAIDMNSVSAIKQHVRDLEHAVEELEHSACMADGHVITVSQDIATLKIQIAECDNNINIILGDGDDVNDHSALPIQVRLEAFNRTLEDKHSELSAAKSTAVEINDAASALNAKKNEMVGQLGRLEAMERTAKAKSQGTAALKRAGDALSSATSVSVDDVAARLRQQANVEDQRFKRALQGVKASGDQDVALIKAKAALEERKKKLAAAVQTSS